MKAAIVLNSKRVTDDLKTTLESKELTEKYQIDYDVYICEPQDIVPTLQEILTKSYSAFVIGGGDGTVCAACQVLINTDKPVAILPLGTFNFLGRELNHENDINKIFEMMKNNKTKLIDLGKVNDQVFINHTWVGFYTHILKMREKHKEILGRSRLLKLIYSSIKLFEVLPLYTLKLHLDDKTVTKETCLLYIGNNDHFKNFGDFGFRKTLSSGLLSISVLNCHTKWELFKCMVSILFNRFENSKYLSLYTSKEVIIESKSAKVNMVIDGELYKLDSPLHFQMYPKVLQVFIP